MTTVKATDQMNDNQIIYAMQTEKRILPSEQPSYSAFSATIKSGMPEQVISVIDDSKLKESQGDPHKMMLPNESESGFADNYIDSDDFEI